MRLDEWRGGNDTHYGSPIATCNRKLTDTVSSGLSWFTEEYNVGDLGDESYRP